MTDRRMILFCVFVLSAALIMAGCSRPEGNRLQGYIEGEFVYISSPLAGRLVSLAVQRGDRIKAGDLLFSLDSSLERDSRAEAEHRLAQAQAELKDARKGKRPSELETLEAGIKEAKAALKLSAQEFVRKEELLRHGLVAAQDFDRVRAARDRDRQRVAGLEADLLTAKLGARTDRIAAAEANLHALKASLDKRAWELTQKQQTAPQEGLVFDTLYREGEWVPAGRPVVALLPPVNVKVRAFVPERQIGKVRINDSVHIFVDGLAEPLMGKVSFISPEAEYTPPVIYSRESRSKLVFMLEATLSPERAASLHPGQPVELELLF